MSVISLSAKTPTPWKRLTEETDTGAALHWCLSELCRMDIVGSRAGTDCLGMQAADAYTRKKRELRADAGLARKPEEVF